VAGVADYKPFILEKWTQAKNAQGSLEDTLVTRTTMYGEFKKRSLETFGRSYEGNQIKMADSFSVKVRHNGIDPDGKYKLVYRGRRHTITSIEHIDEKRFNTLLTVQAK
jgi:hypothetical protein